MSKSLLHKVRIVLVETNHPGNIGAVARAMKNMGLSDLVLVSPRDFPHEKASWRAAGAQDVLENARCVSSLQEALAECAFVVGTSARSRTITWPQLPARQCVEKIYQELPSSRAAIVFGREDRGLTNEELKHCHLHGFIPSNPDYGVLNVAMAAQLFCYELRMLEEQDELRSDSMEGWDIPFADTGDVHRFFEHMEKTLLGLRFLNPKAPKQLITRLRRLFMRTRMDEMEISILRGVLSAADKAVSASKVADNTLEKPE